MRCFFALVAVVVGLLASAPRVNAQACSSVAAGDAATCYSLRANCHYSWPTAQCVTGAPAVCTDYWGDTTGCQSGVVANCSMSTVGTKTCVTTPPACSTLNGNPTSCGGRSDCHYFSNNQTCAVGPAYGSCTTMTTQQQCAANPNFCQWDVYLGACYVGMAEILSVYPCTFWSAFPPSAQACTYHFCSLVGSTCLNPDSGNNYIDNSSTVLFSATTSWVNARITAGTTVFRVDIWRPLALVFCNPGPLWPIIAVGSGTTPYTSYNTPGYGTSAGNATTLPVCFTPTNPSALQAYFNNWITNNNNYNWNLTDPLGQQMVLARGYMLVGGNSTIERISISADSSSVVYSAALELNTVVSLMASRGASLLITSSTRQYTVPLLVADHTTDDSYLGTPTIFYPTVGTTGSVVLTVASRYPSRAFLKFAQFNFTAPAVATQFYAVDLVYSQIIDTTVVIGPRYVSDIVWSSPISPTGPLNAYGTTVVNVSLVGCVPAVAPAVGNVCTTQVTFVDLARPITTDGLAFINANGAYAADRIAIMGSNIPFPTALNGVHSFFANVYSCPAQRTTDAGCILINASPVGYPDQITVSLSDPVFPASQQSGSLVVVGGLLPTPQSPLSALQVQSGGQGDLRNTQVAWGRTVTFVLLMNDTTLQTQYDLRMLLGNITFTPISTTGVVLGNVTYHWSDVAACAVAVPKNRLATCASCFTVPACNGVLGCDALAVPEACFAAITGNKFNGFQASFGYSYYNGPMPTAGVTVQSGPATRRLLQSGGDTINYSGVNTLQFFFPGGSTDTTSSPTTTTSASAADPFATTVGGAHCLTTSVVTAIAGGVVFVAGGMLGKVV